MARVPKVKFKINLEELFDGARTFDRATKEAVGQAIIDKIVERTQSGIDKNGRQFRSYSKEYMQSLEFKVAGKSSLVDMTLTGDMLSSINIIEQTPRTITIGFDDPNENAKAYGHISGMKGHPTIKNGKVRDFFGLPTGELNKIADEFKDQVEVIESIETAQTREEFEQRVEAAIDRLRGQIAEGLEEGEE